MRTSAVWLLGGALLAAACSSKKTETPNSKAAAEAPAKEAAPKTGPVARVNGVDIPRETFKRDYARTLERYKRAGHKLPDSLKERLKDNTVRRLVDAEIIAQQAKDLKVKLDDKEVERRWSEHKARYGTPEAFAAFLTRSKLEEGEVKGQFLANMTREALFKKVSEKVAVTPEEVKAHYDQFKQRYDEPARVRARHILIRVKPSDPKAVKAEKRKKAEAIAKKAKKTDDAGFAKLASEFGEDATKSRGGDLGAFGRGRMVKAFEDAAWKLKKGQVSGVVETQFGYHIIRKTDFQPAKKRSFAEVKDQIERSLLARARNKTIREALEAWKKGAKVEIFEKADLNIIRGPAKKPTKPATQPAAKPAAQPAEKPAIQPAKKPAAQPAAKPAAK